MTKPATVTTLATNEIKLLILTYELSMASTDDGLPDADCTRLFIGKQAFEDETGMIRRLNEGERSSRGPSIQTGADGIPNRSNADPSQFLQWVESRH